jgi:hypothetical protein
MTEIDWLAFANPARMLELLRGKASERKLRLFACACCRGIWRLVTDPGLRDALASVELHAEGLLSADAIRAVADTAEALAEVLDESGTATFAKRAVARAVAVDAFDAAWRAADQVGDAISEEGVERAGYPSADEVYETAERADRVEAVRQCDLLRCIFGDPFRSVSFNSAWRTRTVTALAHAAYEQRHLPSGHLDDTRLTILADALEDADADGALLDHLRGPGPHVRGCWSVDLCLGRE